MIEEIASEGVMVSGMIVRSADPAQKQPEVIRIDQVFIGDIDQKELTISRSDSEYEELLIRPSIGCGAKRFPPAGMSFARMILLPVKANLTRNAGWRTHEFFPIEDSEYLDKLFAEAEAKGRLRKRPPPLVKYWWNAEKPALPLPK
jgi:hypothetical protein